MDTEFPTQEKNRIHIAALGAYLEFVRRFLLDLERSQQSNEEYTSDPDVEVPIFLGTYALNKKLNSEINEFLFGLGQFPHPDLEAHFSSYAAVFLSNNWQVNEDSPVYKYIDFAKKLVYKAGSRN